MAYSFGDGFDLYALPADMLNGYWDSATNIGGFSPLSPGRFGSQCLRFTSANSNLVKSSGVNDAVHHLVVSFEQTAAVSGSTLGAYFQLTDGSTAQCSIVFRSDGAILLTSGASTGTVLATYTGAFPVASTWYAFEFEVVISNTSGSFTVRKNGNNVADFTATSLNTRGGTANNYANKLQIGNGSTVVSSHFIDDLFWQSGAATGVWLGDIRCFIRMPASDQSVQFARTSTGALTQTSPVQGGGQSTSIANNTAVFTAFIAGYSGTVTSVGISTATGNSGNMKCAIFADNGANGPGAVLASATAVVNPVLTGTNTFAFTGVAIVKGVQYWVGAMCDTSVGSWNNPLSAQTTMATATQSYAAFPQANPVTTSPIRSALMSWTYASTPANWQAVSEPQQDGATSYVFDSNPGDADFYGVASIASTPTTVIATTVRAYMQKSDAGTRTAAVQLKSGATTVASPTLVLTTSGWQWAWRMDLTDPNTGAAWTAAAVNSAQIGPKVVA
jgi:hypothetical protein